MKGKKFKISTPSTLTWLAFITLFGSPFLNVATVKGISDNHLNYLHLLDDQLMYRIAFKPAEDFSPELEEKETNRNKVIKITSADQEKYKCILPSVNIYSKKRIESYVGPTPAQLLQPIYDDSICSYKFETYWNYELCHGRFVLQYHEEKETKQRTEYFLGSYVSVSAAMEAKTFDQLNPPTKKIGDEIRAFYPVTYTHGTVCDITGKPRQTVVMYVCDEDARQNIFSFTEVSSCKYEVIILCSELCAHPAFQLIPHKEHEISCFPIKEDQENPKPKALIKIEEDTDKQFIREFGLYRDFSSAKSAKQIFSKLFQVEEEVIEDGFDQLNKILESIKKVAQQQRSTDSSQLSQTLSDSIKTNKKKQGLHSQHAEMQKIVNGFWQGKVCLHGGTGWWKYEVCYRKAVNQYHVETNAKSRQNILLGLFDRDVHKAWAKEHPGKVIERKPDGRIVQVVNMYTQGDICQENGAYRSCELRIRCRDDNTAPRVFIYMLEPSTCQYIVVLESSYFCDALQKVDEFGLLSDETLLEIDKHDRKDQLDEDDSGMDEEQLLPERIDLEENLEHGEDQSKIQKTKVEINIMNQQDLMRIMQTFLNGMERGQNPQMVLDVTKIFKIDDNEDESEDTTAKTDQNSENAQNNHIETDAEKSTPTTNEEHTAKEKINNQEQNSDQLESGQQKENTKNQDIHQQQRHVNGEL